MADPASTPSAASSPGDELPHVRTLRRINDLLGKLELSLLALFLAVLVLVSAYFAVASKVLGRQDTWPYEIIRYSVFFVAMAGAALAAQRQGLFNMDLVTRRFSPRARSILRIATAALVVVLCGVVVRAGLDVRRIASEIEKGHEIISEAQAALAIIGGFGLVAIHFALHGLIEVAILSSGKIPPDPPHGGHA